MLLVGNPKAKTKKYKPKSTTMKNAMIKAKHYLAMLLMTVIIPAVSQAQLPGPEDGEVGPDVPFDKDMNLVFLIIGVLFAAVIVWQELRKRKRLQGSQAK
jgi:hypothetical protein